MTFKSGLAEQPVDLDSFALGHLSAFGAFGKIRRSEGRSRWTGRQGDNLLRDSTIAGSALILSDTLISIGPQRTFGGKETPREFREFLPRAARAARAPHGLLWAHGQGHVTHSLAILSVSSVQRSPPAQFRLSSLFVWAGAGSDAMRWVRVDLRLAPIRERESLSHIPSSDLTRVSTQSRHTAVSSHSYAYCTVVPRDLQIF